MINLLGPGQEDPYDDSLCSKSLTVYGTTQYLDIAGDYEQFETINGRPSYYNAAKGTYLYSTGESGYWQNDDFDGDLCYGWEWIFDAGKYLYSTYAHSEPGTHICPPVGPYWAASDVGYLRDDGIQVNRKFELYRQKITQL